MRRTFLTAAVLLLAGTIAAQAQTHSQICQQYGAQSKQAGESCFKEGVKKGYGSPSGINKECKDKNNYCPAGATPTSTK